LIIETIKNQINLHFAEFRNLFINTTWFGPQFDNGEYDKFLSLIASGEKFDQVFLLAAADPVFLNSDQIQDIVSKCSANKMFLLGHFDSSYYFNFHSTVLPKYFKKYDPTDLQLTNVKWIYLNYNRKPRGHRIELVNKLVNHQLDELGIITLGQDDEKNTYSQGLETIQHFTLNEQIDDYAREGNWGNGMKFGIPHDIHSLGNMHIWQHHFLTVVSETEFFPWDNTFVSEKTWKPILGSRPFLINGQTKIYQWLRDHGFRTFNHYWPQIELENVTEFEVHDSIVAVLKFLSQLSTNQLFAIYQDMLPDLLHNRARFFEFGKEQKYKIENLFK
jgi:hypothetical protein